MNEHRRSSESSRNLAVGHTMEVEAPERGRDNVLDGRYELHERLGEGGMGSVYRATHILMGKPVAVKLINEELAHMPSVIKRFEREARSASLLSDPHCIVVTDFGRSPRGELYLVMELLDGEELATRLEREGALPPRTAVDIARQILSALAHAHAAGVVHRDLKPENVMIIEQGGSRDFAKVFDFGIAKIAGGSDKEETLTQAGMVIGTPAYLSPEQALGDQADQRSDIYAVGVMLYQMLSGEVPFRGETAMKVLSRHLSEPVPRLPAVSNLPLALQAVIDTAMAKKPEERFQTAGDFITALDSVDFGREKARKNEISVFRITRDLKSLSVSVVRRIFDMLGSLPPKIRLAVIGTTAAALTAGVIWLPGWFGNSEERAVKELLEVSDAPPGVDENKIERLLEKADEQLRAGLHQPASQTILEVLEISPEQPAGLLLLGHVRFSKTQYSKALELYEKALDAEEDLGSDPRLLEYVSAIFEKTDDDNRRAQAAAVLATRVKRKGLDFLEGQANSMTAGLAQREAARAALIEAGEEDRIDWLVSLTADFNEAKGCKKRIEIIENMAKTGDKGFLPLLRENKPKTVKLGPFRRKSNKCIASTVKKAIKKLDPEDEPKQKAKR